MSLRRNQKRYLDGRNSMFNSKKHNNRKSTNGRINQYIDLKDDDGKFIGRQKLIRHYL